MFSISGIIGCAAFLEILHDTMDDFARHHGRVAQLA